MKFYHSCRPAQHFFEGNSRLRMIKFHFPRTRFSALPGARADRPRNGTVRQRTPADQPRRGDAALVSRLRHERDRGPRAPRRARRPEAGPPPGAVRDARGEQHLEPRSEEHTSELQSLAYLVCRLLLEKKKK